VAPGRKDFVFAGIGEIKIILCKLLIAQYHEFNFGMIPDDAGNGIDCKIPDSVKLFVAQYPAIDGYFHE